MLWLWILSTGEAAACGLASVLVKDSCAAEGITDGRNGYLIEENGESMAALLRELGRNPEKMRECGRHAMDEIYISWEDSVKEAYKRYAEISEMVASGEMKRRKPHASDFVLEAVAGMAEASRKIYSIPAGIIEGMMDNVAELQVLGQQTKENIKQSLKKAGESIEQGVENIKKLPIGKQ